MNTSSIMKLRTTWKSQSTLFKSDVSWLAKKNPFKMTRAMGNMYTKFSVLRLNQSIRIKKAVYTMLPMIPTKSRKVLVNRNFSSKNRAVIVFNAI